MDDVKGQARTGKGALRDATHGDGEADGRAPGASTHPPAWEPSSQTPNYYNYYTKDPSPVPCQWLLAGLTQLD